MTGAPPEAVEANAAASEGLHAHFDAVFAAFSEIGRSNDTGVERLAFGSADAAVRAEFEALCVRHGLHYLVDPIGNQFALVYPPSDPRPLVLVGSHLDSQPDGGRFDGQVGVAAAIAVVVSARDTAARDTAARDTGGPGATRALGAVNWANEEGARFQPSVMGSSVFTGQLPLATALGSRDAAGALLADEITDRALGGSDGLTQPVAAYAELHVEQGSVLEDAGQHIGIVDGTWAAHKADVRVRGIQTHTGPTPMARRVDALAAAAQLIAGLRELGLADPDGLLHTAVAWLRITPNSPNATPSLVEFKVELRSPEERRVQRAREAMAGLIRQVEDTLGVTCEVGAWSERSSASFPEALVGVAESCVAGLGLRSRRMPTIAGHDAVIMNAAGIPTALLFVPSAGGITHNAKEFTSPDDLRNGVAALAAVTRQLIESGGRLSD